MADRLAGLYGQYLVYRRDWLDDWERQRPGKAPDHWQGALWRALVASVGRSHRGQRMGELIARLERLPPDPEQPALHVFGISHLPPDALSALERLATTREVCLYFPDPCRELWEDLRTRREIFQAQLEGGDYLTLGHPLLAALGRMGQHFALQLNALAADSDDRDHDDSSLDGPLAAGATCWRACNTACARWSRNGRGRTRPATDGWTPRCGCIRVTPACANWKCSRTRCSTSWPPIRRCIRATSW